MTFYEQRGRLPRNEERGSFAELEEALGSVRNAFSIVRRLTGDERWDRMRVTRSDDLLVYLALSRFGRRPTIQYEQAASDLLATAPEIKQLLSSLGAAPGGYPLHPTAIPALVELAGRFGQHDRSLMAFLTSDDPHALPAFMRDQSVVDEVPFVRLDRIYDYIVAGAAAWQ